MTVPFSGELFCEWRWWICCRCVLHGDCSVPTRTSWGIWQEIVDHETRKWMKRKMQAFFLSIQSTNCVLLIKLVLCLILINSWIKYNKKWYLKPTNWEDFRIEFHFQFLLVRNFRLKEMRAKKTGIQYFSDMSLFFISCDILCVITAYSFVLGIAVAKLSLHDMIYQLSTYWTMQSRLFSKKMLL